jgi:hypothetical protein
MVLLILLGLAVYIFCGLVVARAFHIWNPIPEDFIVVMIIGAWPICLVAAVFVWVSLKGIRWVRR